VKFPTDLIFAGGEYASDKEACSISQLASWNTGDSSEMLLDQQYIEVLYCS